LANKTIKELFLAHRRELQTYLTRLLRNAEVASDLTQETFLRFAERHGENPAAAVTHERSYLYRTAHNLAIDYIRREKRERTDPVANEGLSDFPDEGPSPERTISGKDELALMRAALLELPERTRQIFVLARIEELTYREVATRLRISESSVQKHLAMATKHVMQRLRRSPPRYL